MFEAHEGYVKLEHSFSDTWRWLRKVGPVELFTSVETPFEAAAAVTQSGRHSGRPVIRFFQQGKEYARAYQCCWRRYYNCNRTRIGMYCEALDAEVP